MLKYFTLIELLTVIAIILVLISFLLPALERARFEANNAACASNLKQIGMGLLNFGGDHDNWYPKGYKKSDLGLGLLFQSRAKSWQYNINGEWKDTFGRYFGNAPKTWHNLDWEYNKTFACPQGMSESPIQGTINNIGAFYSIQANWMGGTRGGSSPMWFYEVGTKWPVGYEHLGHNEGDNTGRATQPSAPHDIMRKVGDVHRLSYLWSSKLPPLPEFNVLASDVTERYGHDGGGTITNHIWGGIRRASGNYTPLPWSALSGGITTNYIHDDGSLSIKRNWKHTDLSQRKTFYVTNGGGQGGDSFGYPADLDIAER
jgi:type II secretory pathway pseudopilin PulG